MSLGQPNMSASSSPFCDCVSDRNIFVRNQVRSKMRCEAKEQVVTCQGFMSIVAAKATASLCLLMQMLEYTFRTILIHKLTWFYIMQMYVNHCICPSLTPFINSNLDLFIHQGALYSVLLLNSDNKYKSVHHFSSCHYCRAGSCPSCSLSPF